MLYYGASLRLCESKGLEPHLLIKAPSAALPLCYPPIWAETSALILNQFIL